MNLIVVPVMIGGLTGFLLLMAWMLARRREDD